MKKIIVVIILVSLFFGAFLLNACSGERVIEKIIYGDSREHNGNNLSRDEFNAIAVSRVFNTIDDFYGYMRQCHTNKTDLTGLKFKVVGSFALNDYLNYDIRNNKYRYKSFSITTNTSIRPYMHFSVGFLDTNLDSNITLIEEVIFIVEAIWYYYTSGAENMTISGYGYL